VFCISEYFFHIGLQKTGTTFLQKEIFPQLKKTCYFSFYKAISELDTLRLSKNENQVFNAAKKIKKVFNGEKNLISYELLYDLYFMDQTELNRVANRIKKFFPNAKIILGIREQASAINSIYKQYVFSGGY